MVIKKDGPGMEQSQLGMQPSNTALMMRVFDECCRRPKTKER